MMKNAHMTTADRTEFRIRVPGKWILAGEHAVLRGHEALVFPLSAKYLDLTYLASTDELELILEGDHRFDLDLIVWSVLEKAFRELGLKRQNFNGQLRMRSQIAFGGGMGASATLCVALTEWLASLGHISSSEKFNFARKLENLFHGESSGVDVAVTLMNKPLIFTRHNGFSDLHVKHHANLYLSYTGQRGATKDCVDQVKNIFVTDPLKAEAIDQQMKESVEQFKYLLTHSAELTDWAKAIHKSQNCFEKWGLITEQVKQHQKTLVDAGALAVKLTGSGGGGYVLSLWEKAPPLDLPFEMIACFSDQ